MKGKKLSEQHKQKISNTLTGRKLSEEHKRKIGEKGKGRKGFWKGKKHSESTRKKMSEWHKRNSLNRGRKLSEEQKKKLRDAHIGKKLSEEHKKKISNASRGSKHWNWKGGVQNTPGGYVRLKRRNHPFSDVAGYIFRSHLVMEKKLGRYLRPEEVVHHVNGIKNDDRIENLRLFASKSKHTKFHVKGGDLHNVSKCNNSRNVCR